MNESLSKSGRAAQSAMPSSPPADPDQLLSFAEGIAVLRIGRRLGWELVNRGELPHLRIGKLIRFRRASLLAWAESQEKRGRR